MAIIWGERVRMTYGKHADGTIDYSKPNAEPMPDFAGAVLGTTHRCERIMSDVWAECYYAIVWTGERVAEYCYANSEFGNNGTTVAVDATPDAIEAAAAWTLAKAVKDETNRRERMVYDAKAAARELRRDRMVRVVRGRKIAIGTEGKCFWIGSTQYGVRAGIELANGERVFTAATNLEVTNADAYYIAPTFYNTIDEAAAIAVADGARYTVAA